MRKLSPKRGSDLPKVTVRINKRVPCVVHDVTAAVLKVGRAVLNSNRVRPHCPPVYDSSAVPCCFIPIKSNLLRRTGKSCSLYQHLPPLPGTHNTKSPACPEKPSHPTPSDLYTEFYLSLNAFSLYLPGQHLLIFYFS